MTPDLMVQTAINIIRTLSIDAVQQAESGHPGTPMALAPLIYTLWNRVMRFDPCNCGTSRPFLLYRASHCRPLIGASMRARQVSPAVPAYWPMLPWAACRKSS
jgi:transketolase N-terminal domain/subunit